MSTLAVHEAMGMKVDREAVATLVTFFGSLPIVHTMRTASVTVASPCGPTLAARRLDRERTALGRSSRGDVSDVLWASAVEEGSRMADGKPFVP